MRARQLTKESATTLPGPISFTVPSTPPSVNHYKKPVKIRLRDGSTHSSYALTDEALAFKRDLAVFARDCHTLTPQSAAEKRKVRYWLYAQVFLGFNERLDGDNGWKCLADAMKDAGLIHSDARVKRWIIDVHDDERDNPRTVVSAGVFGPGAFPRICADPTVSNSL